MHLGDGRVDVLKDANDERGGLTHTRLGLGNGVTSGDHGHDGALLDGGRLLETVGVDATEEFISKLHVVKGLMDIGIVGGDLVSTFVGRLDFAGGGSFRMRNVCGGRFDRSAKKEKKTEESERLPVGGAVDRRFAWRDSAKESNTYVSAMIASGKLSRGKSFEEALKGIKRQGYVFCCVCVWMFVC